MPKMKTKKCAVKRMKLSKKGKVLRSQGGHAHLNNGKKRNRKNNLCGRTAVDSLKVTKTYARALQGRYSKGGIRNACYQCSRFPRTPPPAP